ncbi:glycosyltransferase [Planctomycetota bacterium]
MLESLLQNARDQFDLTEQSAHDHLYQLVNALLASEITTARIKQSLGNAPLEFRLAEKLVDSRRYLQTISQPLKIAVVFAMWGEQHRLHPRSATNPNGEDSLRVKLAQLAWATEGTPVEWTLYAVDDGDPHQSGRIAEQIAETHPLGKHVKVLHLDDAVPTSSGPLAGLASAEASRKGGAIVYGAMSAIADGADVVIYTDADNSVHLGQIGLLLRPYLEDHHRVVLGNRKHPDAVLVKQEGRWGIGIKLLRHMQRMVGQPIFSLGIRDTQAAFKLYDGQLLSKIIADPTVYDFSFDTDWMMAAIVNDVPLTTVPFAFIDSAAESASIAQGPMSTWETLLQGLKAAVRKHGLPHDQEMARVLDEEIKSSADLDLLIDRLPAQLANTPDSQLGDPQIMSPAEVQTWIRQCKQ